MRITRPAVITVVNLPTEKKEDAFKHLLAILGWDPEAEFDLYMIDEIAEDLVPILSGDDLEEMLALHPEVKVNRGPFEGYNPGREEVRSLFNTVPLTKG